MRLPSAPFTPRSSLPLFCTFLGLFPGGRHPDSSTVPASLPASRTGMGGRRGVVLKIERRRRLERCGPTASTVDFGTPKTTCRGSGCQGKCPRLDSNHQNGAASQ